MPAGLTLYVTPSPLPCLWPCLGLCGVRPSLFKGAAPLPAWGSLPLLCSALLPPFCLLPPHLRGRGAGGGPSIHPSSLDTEPLEA